MMSNPHGCHLRVSHGIHPATSGAPCKTGIVGCHLPSLILKLELLKDTLLLLCCYRLG
jgi:hypothetical protein